MGKTCAITLLLFLITWLLMFIMSSLAQTCIESERKALIDIERDIYDPDDWLSSWREGGDCCRWQGVLCDNMTGHVVTLDLQYPIQYDDHRKITNPANPSKLNPSLASLVYLQFLDISMNNFSGTAIPPFIGSLVNLQYLDLSQTCFEGTIPLQFGNLSNLQSLYIDYGLDLTLSTLHVDDLHWLSHLTSLYDLEMSGIDLSRAVNWFHDLNMLPNLSILVLEYVGLSTLPTTLPSGRNNFTSLTFINLFGNSFNSTIPSWLLHNMSSLVELDLGVCGLYGGLPHIASSGQFSSNLQVLSSPHNHFDGEIFQQLGGLTKLEDLDLAYNVINVPFSNILWNLTHLKHLDLTSNQITGSLSDMLGNHSQLENLVLSFNNMTGEIPQSIGKLYNLVEFDVSSNQITGSIPDTIGKLRNLTTFALLNNFISGEIPVSLSNLTLLQNLFLSNNNIGGSIPKSIGNLINLAILDLSKNRLNGPMFFCNMSSLSSLDLSNNKLYGRLPWFHNKSSQLENLYLSSNSLWGNIPDSFESLPNLQSLHLGDNNLSGRLPDSLKHCQQLYFLDLSENKLSGTIPAWIGQSLSLLVVLSLRSNRFSGYIPLQLSYLTSLQILDLSDNNLTGNLSLSFANFSAMTVTHTLDDDRAFDLNVPTEYIWLNVKGKLLYYRDILYGTTMIDLSSNSLCGGISNEITQLQGLFFLNLSRNHFSGNIPQNIGAMLQLEQLDLSTNDISGKIPPSMSALHFLSSLNLSDNNLSGAIPSDNTYFTSDDPSIYSGNPGLCGWPLPKCSSSPPKTDGQEKEEDEDDSEMTWVYVGTTVGFMISYSAFIGIMFLNQSVRYAYFNSVDKLQDWIHVKFVLSIAKFK